MKPAQKAGFHIEDDGTFILAPWDATIHRVDGWRALAGIEMSPLFVDMMCEALHAWRRDRSIQRAKNMAEGRYLTYGKARTIVDPDGVERAWVTGEYDDLPYAPGSRLE